jgi:hypothetical protein
VFRTLFGFGAKQPVFGGEGTGGAGMAGPIGQAPQKRSAASPATREYLTLSDIAVATPQIVIPPSEEQQIAPEFQEYLSSAAPQQMYSPMPLNPQSMEAIYQRYLFPQPEIAPLVLPSLDNGIMSLLQNRGTGS